MHLNWQRLVLPIITRILAIGSQSVNSAMLIAINCVIHLLDNLICLIINYSRLITNPSNSSIVINLNSFLLSKNNYMKSHCVKSAQIWNCFWSEYRKIRTSKNSVIGHFSRSVKLILIKKNYFLTSLVIYLLKLNSV